MPVKDVLEFIHCVKKCAVGFFLFLKTLGFSGTNLNAADFLRLYRVVYGFPNDIDVEFSHSKEGPKQRPMIIFQLANLITKHR